jgi:dihydrofolate reductase
MEHSIMSSTMDNLSIIVAMTYGRVIGKDGQIPWHIPEEFRHFREVTVGHTLIMGENTYKSIGHPLKRRNNIVVSPTMPPATKGIIVARNLESALEMGKTIGEPIFSAGGASIYRQTLPLAKHLYVSYVKKDYEGDTFFPEFELDDYLVEEYKDYPEFTFMKYVKRF